jgi:ABC-type multidrug transport system permease subunit
MFESMNAASRVEREREIWIRQMKMGKKRYVFFHTIIYGLAIFMFLRVVIFYFAVYAHPLNSTSKLIVFLIGMPLCYGVGCVIGLLFWRRGVRIASATDTAE